MSSKAAEISSQAAVALKDVNCKVVDGYVTSHYEHFYFRLIKLSEDLNRDLHK